MKILCVVPSYWPAFQYGGPTTAIHTVNKALVKKDIDVSVYTTNVGLGTSVPLNHEVGLDGVKVRYFAFVNFFEFLGKTGWQFSPKMSRALKENLGSFDLAYIAAIWNYPIAIAAYYCRKYRKPYIISPKGLLYPYAMSKNSWKKRIYYNVAIKKNIENATLIQYTTEDEAEKCHSFLRLKNRAMVIPEGIDISEFADLPDREILRRRYPILRDKKVIIFLGRISWKKGLDNLAKAYGRLARERVEVHLLIVGNDEGGYEKKVKKWISDEEVLEKVTFTGMLTGKEKLIAYAGSDLFVLPSYSENFGLSVVEAMACGIPVIISNQIGIYREVKENNAGVVVECNEISLYEGMKAVLDNGKLAKEISFNGKRMVREYYNIDKVADQMIGAFRGILNAK